MSRAKTIITALAVFTASLVYTTVYPCDVAVVSARASSTGRPFIWKNRDCSASSHQEMKYFNAETTKAGAYIMVCAFDDTAKMNNGDPVNPSGGVNEAGFAISCTSVYEELVPLHEAININTDLIRHALQQCATLDDFDALLKKFHLSHLGKVISGNFVAIDARGGAALYEAYTGMITAGLTPVKYRKYDANNGKVVEFNGLFTMTIDSGDGDNFVGFFARSNSNSYIPYNYGEERRWRAEDLFTDMASLGRMNYRTCMSEVAKDVYGKQVDPSGRELDQASCQTDYSTTYCISRAATRLAMVVDGVAAGGDPRLSVFWCALGEPSVAVFVPYFVYAREVSYLSYVDDVDLDGNWHDLNDTSLLARASNGKEIRRMTAATYLYDSNTGDAVKGMDDRSMDKNVLAQIQQWSFPLEESVFQRCEEFMADLEAHPSYITSQNLKNFSNYCAEYAYKNYIEASATQYAWDFSKPWGDPIWYGTNRGGFDNDGGFAGSTSVTSSSEDTGILSGLAKLLGL